jgi:hypothetical protein
MDSTTATLTPDAVPDQLPPDPSVPSAAPTPATPAAPAGNLAPLSTNALNATIHASPRATNTPVLSDALGLSVPDALPPDDMPSPAPQTMRGRILREESAFNEANTVPGTEFDTQSGADAWTRFRLASERTQADKMAYLTKHFGEGNVRMATDGTPIVKVEDEKHPGTFKDILVNPEKITAGDFFALAGHAPEIVGSMLALYAGGTSKVGMLAKLRNLAVMAAGQEGGGAIQDVANRKASGQPVDPHEIVGSRAEMAGYDMAAGALLGTLGKAGSKLKAPFASADLEAADARAAAKYLGNRLSPGNTLPMSWPADAPLPFYWPNPSANGYKIPQTVGEATGNKFFQRVEAQVGQKPGSSAAFEAIRKEQNAALVKIQNMALGLPADATEADVAALPTSEETGTKAMEAIEGKVAPAKAAVDAAGKDLAETGSAEIRKGLGATGAGPVDVPALGARMRAVAMARREQFEAKSAEDYGKVYAHPLANSYVLSSDKLAADASALLKQLPAPETITETPTGIVDQFGNEILRDESGRKVMRNFVPPNVLTKLNDLSALKGGKFRLGDLLKMRTDVSNDIAQGEAIPGMNTHYLSQIRGMLTDTINSELDKLPDDSLKTLWKTANDNYAAGVKQFTKTGISELYRAPEQGGYLGDSQVVRRALSGPNAVDQFRAYKEFYGENSPEFKAVKQSVLDDLVGRSEQTSVRIPGAGEPLIDANKFVQNLVALKQNQPEIANEVLPNSTKLANSGLLMQAGLDTAVGKAPAQAFSGKVSVSDLEGLVRSGDLTATRLNALIDKQDQLSTIYQNKIIHQIATGKFIGDKINPTEFASRFASAEPKDIHQVMAMLSDRPDILQEIKSATVRDIFNDATVLKGQTAGQLLKDLPGQVNSSGLIGALGDRTQKERFRAILGDMTYKDIEEMAKFLGPMEKTQQVYKSAAGLQIGAQIAGLERGGVFKFGGQVLRGMFIGTTLTSPPIRAWLSNVAVTPENASAVANAMIASTPFVEQLYRTLGPDEGARVASEMRESIQMAAKEQGKATPPKGQP